MADKQVSALPQVGSINDGAKFVLEQDGTAYHATAAQIKALVPSSGGSSGDSGSSGGTADLTGAVRYDQAQSLTDDQKAQARSNVGAVSEADVTQAINTALGDYAASLAEMDEVIG